MRLLSWFCRQSIFKLTTCSPSWPLDRTSSTNKAFRSRYQILLASRISYPVGSAFETWHRSEHKDFEKYLFENCTGRMLEQHTVAFFNCVCVVQSSTKSVTFVCFALKEKSKHSPKCNAYLSRVIEV